MIANESLLVGPLLVGALTTWLTPIWLLSVGATLGMLVVAVLAGLVWLVWPHGRTLLGEMTAEVVPQVIFYVLLFWPVLALIASLGMPASRLYASATRILAVGDRDFEVKVPPRTEAHPLEVSFRTEELISLRIESDQDLVIAADEAGTRADEAIEVQGGDTTRWIRKVQGDVNPFVGDVSEIVITNESDAPANVTLRVTTGVEYPEVFSVPVAAAGVIGFALLYFLFRAALPKIGVIALTTSKQCVTQPIYLLAIGIGLVALLAFVYVPYNTFGEDVKMLKMSGLDIIKVLAILVATWTAGVSVADEIEGRTAVTLLSKPVGRRQFILGKFFGISWPLALLFILLGLWFLSTVSYKVVYDARETANPEPIWQDCYVEMVRSVPGLVLAFLEVVMMTSISVAISTRLPIIANMIVCWSIYILGHLVPLIVNSSVAEIEPVRFVGLLIATVIPVLDHFNMEAAVVGGREVPLIMMGTLLLYAALYSTIMLLLAFAFFESRDLA